jgi:cytochrome c556
MRRLGLVLAGLMAISGVSLWADEDSAITVIMKKCHKPKTGYRDLVAVEVEKKPPKWDDIQKMTKDFVTQASALPKLDPPKGTKASWQKLTAAYLVDVKALDEATAKKDVKAVKTANDKLAGGCMDCHDLHRE